MFKQTLAAASVAVASFFGTGAHSATFDLAFIMDSSGSVGSANFSAAMSSLATALDNSLTQDVLDVDQYNITVVRFAGSASVVVGPTLVSNTTELAAVTSAISSVTFTAGQTNYTAAFNALQGAAGALSAGSSGSIINMMTDGEPVGDNNADIIAARNSLINTGWDSLSFEAVEDANGNTPDSDFLAGLAFDTGGVGTTNIINDPNDINDPLNETFVLEVSGFGTAYDAAIGAKVQKIVTPDPVPVPAALPLLAGGLMLMGFVGRRRRAAA